MLKSLMQLLSSGLMVRMLELLRTAILARLLTVEDYGIVATFFLPVALVQMAGAFSLDKLVVQDREGDTPGFVASLHTVQLVRGLLGAVLLVVLAGPYARLLGVEGLIWPYQALAMFPLVAGIVNLNL